MALAFESINKNIIKKLKWRSSPLNQTKWLTKVPFTRLVSFAVPKNDIEDETKLRYLREKNILSGGYLWNQRNTGENMSWSGPSQEYSYGNQSYRGTPKGSVSGYAGKNAFGDPLEIPAGESRRLVPNPGIVSMNIKNKGSFGSLREINFQIKCYDLNQLETLEVLYMTPGVGVLCEWGWSYMGSEPSLVSNTTNNNFADKEKLQHEINSKVKSSEGNYDACIATITGFNWSIEKDGSYNVQVNATSRGETMLLVPVNRSNSVLVDYVARLSYDPDVANLAANMIKNANDPEDSDIAKLGAGNISTVAGDNTKINLLQVPVWKYNFGQKKLSGTRAEQEKDIKEKEEEKKKIEQAEQEEIIELDTLKEFWYKTVQITMRKYRMTEMQVGISLAPAAAGTALPMSKLSTYDAAGNFTLACHADSDWRGEGGAGTSSKPKTGPGWASLFQNIWGAGFSNMNVYDLAHYPDAPHDNSKIDYFMTVGYGIHYNWAWSSLQYPSDAQDRYWDLMGGTVVQSDGSNLDRFPSDYRDKNGIVGNNGEGNGKMFKPAFISKLQIDGGLDPLVLDADENEFPVDLFSRGNLKPSEKASPAPAGTAELNISSFFTTFASNTVHELRKSDGTTLYNKSYYDTAGFDSSMKFGEGKNSINKLFKLSPPTSDFANKFPDSLSNSQRLELMLTKPNYAMNGYGDWSQDDGNTSTAGDEVSHEIWSAPEMETSDDQTDEGPVKLDATFWNKKTNFLSVEKEFGTRSTAQGQTDLGVTTKWPAKVEPWKEYMSELPRLPMYSVGVGFKGATEGIITKGGAGTNGARKQAKEYTTKDGNKLYSYIGYYSFVDMQEWDTAKGEFKYVAELKRKREELADSIAATIKELSEAKKEKGQQIQDAKDYLTALNKNTGEYIPIWALEHLFNHCVNYSVKGKKIFRYDSGFLSYYDTNGQSFGRPADITETAQKEKILKEYAELFDVLPDFSQLISVVDENEEEMEVPVFSEDGAHIFYRFFALGTDENTTKALLSNDWEPQVSLPVKIPNHKQLRSTDPLRCLLPGQEDIVPNSNYITGKSSRNTAQAGPEYSADELMELSYDKEALKKAENLPKPELWVGLQLQHPDVRVKKLEDLEDIMHPDNDSEYPGLLSDPDLLWPNPFKTDNNMNSGYVSNILVHIDVIKEALKLGSVDQDAMHGGQNMEVFAQVYQKILNRITISCGQMWDLGLQVEDNHDNVCKIIDTKYRKDIKKTNDIIWQFPLYGSGGTSDRGHHIIRDFAIQSEIPSAMKAMAMYGTNAAFGHQLHTGDMNDLSPLQLLQNIDWADVSLEGMVYDSDRYHYKDGTMQLKNSSGIANFDGTLISIDDLAKKGDIFDVVESTEDGAGDAAVSLSKENQSRMDQDQIPITYQDQITMYRSSLEKIHDNGPKDAGGKHTRLAEKCLYAMLTHVLPVSNEELDEILNEIESTTQGASNYTRESYLKEKSQQEVEKTNPNFFNTLIPLNCSITLDGISGIHFGNSFALKGLPKRYEKKTAFQVTNVAHQIDTNGWQTTISAQMRTIAESAQDKIIDFADADTIQDSNDTVVNLDFNALGNLF